MEASTFQCSCCGQTFSGPPLAWHFEAPDAWLSLAADEQETRGRLSSDQCIIDGEEFFIRGLVELPIVGEDEVFAWGVWVSLSRKNFDRASALWEDEARVSEGPYFGWFCNSLPGYPETLNLKTRVHTRAVGLRPTIELEPTDHPLAVEQRTGITRARVQGIAEQMYHQNEVSSVRV
jgi:hypothetical protein